MSKPQKDKKLPKVHPELEGLNIWVNSFGEIERSHSVEEINRFLNKKVVDKKLKDRLGFRTSEDDDTIDHMY